MKVKKFIIILLMCIMTCVSVLLVGCTDPWDIKKEENGFYYVLCKENGEFTESVKDADGAIILGRVDSDEVIDELIIPQELGGFPVKQIGAFYHPIEGHDEAYNINCTNINKITINHSCDLNYAFNNLGGELIINADVLISSADQFTPYSHRTIGKLIRFNIDLQTLTDYETWSRVWDHDWGIAPERQLKKVEFDAVGGQQTTYAYVVQTNTCIISPEVPTKEGYTFSGWYDESYENQWDFETDKLTENITLYAKWTAK